jgi:hypothetical protein
MGVQWVGGRVGNCGRILRYYCYNCGWQSAPMTPPQIEVETKRTQVVGFGLYDYTIYDRFGWVMIYSQSYRTESEAMEQMRADLKRGLEDKDAGPYTAVMWPHTVEIQGKVFKGDDNG